MMTGTQPYDQSYPPQAPQPLRHESRLVEQLNKYRKRSRILAVTTCVFIVTTILLAAILVAAMIEGGKRSASSETQDLANVSSVCSKIVDDHKDDALVIQGDKGDTVSVHQPPESTGETLSCVAKQTHMPDSVYERINASKNDAETQNGDWNGLHATWNWSHGTLIVTIDAKD